MPAPLGQSAPVTLRTLVDRQYARMREDGWDDSEAAKVALRTATHAGWFQTRNGWKQIGPDLRDKINLRSPHKQPDGRFLIEDVDVFYPNAVKDEMSYTPDDVRTIIENTNRGILAGGQRPALVKMHPNAMQKMQGVVLPTFGTSINFRESPRGKGWARCDLIDVDPSLVAEWRNGAITGLSAGIVQDAAGLNRRFGHVALLGAESQALSHLPTHELFSSDAVCFSADPRTFQPLTGALMDPVKAQKMHAMFSAVAAAYAACAANEPGATDKLKEAQANYSACKADFEADMGMMPGAEEPIVADTPVDPMAGGAPAAPTETPAPAVPNFEADPAGAFSAVQRQVELLETRTRRAEAQNALLRGNIAKQDFGTFLKDLTAAGHQFDAASANSMFSACSDNPKAIGELKKMLKASPKTQSLASVQVFGADGVRTPGPASTIEQEVAELNRMFPERNFTAADVKVAG